MFFRFISNILYCNIITHAVMAKVKSTKVSNNEPTKKRKNSKAKGGAYERSVAKRLSLWYTNNKRDDVFYRSASSGGRSTQRFKKGKQTVNAAGDLSYTDSIGEPFLKCVAVELKAGYDSPTLSKTCSGKKPKLFDFFKQAQESAEQAGVQGWLIVHKPDFQTEMVYMNAKLFTACFNIDPLNIPTDASQLPFPMIAIFIDNSQSVVGFSFETFLMLDPKRFRPEVLFSS